MKSEDLRTMNLVLLSEQEINEINGGEGILSDVGYAIGYSARMVYEFFSADWGSLSPSNGYATAKIG